MSLTAFRGTSRALRTLPRWAAATTVTAARARVTVQCYAARRAQSSSAVSLEGQQSVRHGSTTSASAAETGVKSRGADADAGQKLLSAHLREADPAVFEIIEKEKKRQKHSINLIPSENFTSQAVLDALGSVMQSGNARSKEDGSVVMLI
jgi:glycine hydroxymethyltransferase